MKANPLNKKGQGSHLICYGWMCTKYSASWIADPFASPFKTSLDRTSEMLFISTSLSLDQIFVIIIIIIETKC